MSVAENTAQTVVIYAVSYSDVDTTQTHTFTMTSSPGTGLTYFTIDSSTGEVKISTTTLNYETLAALGTLTFTLSVTVSDGVTSDTQTLVIDVTNVNEAPSFSQSAYTISANENAAGVTVGSPDYGVTDPDAGDTATFTFDCGADTGYFSIHSTTGAVTFQSDYDLDSGSQSAAVTCTVTITDTGVLTDTATLGITILDTNDNNPLFTPGAYSFFISHYATAGDDVGTVTASDADAGVFGTLTLSLDQSSLLDSYFAISNAGVITVQTSLVSLGSATAVTVTAVATDTGGLSATAVITIIVSGTTTTSTTTTTDRYMTFMEDSSNVAWMVALALLLLVCACVVGWMAYTCKGDEGCSQCMRKW